MPSAALQAALSASKTDKAIMSKVGACAGGRSEAPAHNHAKL